MDKPLIIIFHGYTRLVHLLAYRRSNHRNLHVQGYKEKGIINTTLELAIENEIDRSVSPSMSSAGCPDCRLRVHM